MSIDIERLKVDPDYWHEVAPLGATHHWEPSGEWYQDCGDYALAWIFGKEEWAQAISPLRIARPEAIPRPAKPEPKEWQESILDRIGELGNQVHNLGCNWQNDEDISEELGKISVQLWELQKQAHIRTQAERDKAELNQIIDAAMRHGDGDVASAIVEAGWIRGERQ